MRPRPGLALWVTLLGLFWRLPAVQSVDREVRVGVVLPLTGPLAPLYQDVARGTSRSNWQRSRENAARLRQAAQHTRDHVQEPCRLRPFLSPLPVTPSCHPCYPYRLLAHANPGSSAGMGATSECSQPLPRRQHNGCDRYASSLRGGPSLHRTRDPHVPEVKSCPCLHTGATPFLLTRRHCAPVHHSAPC
jgi:hypothetical protein